MADQTDSGTIDFDDLLDLFGAGQVATAELTADEYVRLTIALGTKWARYDADKYIINGHIYRWWQHPKDEEGHVVGLELVKGS
jgi:hypothetical protein